ncbi:FdhF/YdeP family oxidoreductase [[Kitasatospora] papulosa]|jgi:molybdopterin-dependent oxidoreductase alpha subunit|uniref:Oxidoreductase alpha (Molybdopterin) subunit n=1 Tax=Streptomyces pratensis (strain ATCC 33331 / IAF-45CD) TaxID=591167 RepID=A0A8D3WK72_STRFA|nr:MULTISPECIES: FdhF/YdeP family oxidoreductase [Streptomyces]MDF9873405.1 molybdopterin-dependent oxidoreductase alpha subunit [Streptomyces pratensis]MCX4413386.1 FdhF/YdeP family oxidoreductase [[Kitasatospora] papulosa]MDX3184630.1 FdhF/YdeP family oxidoreductase [Streptomyces sp. ME02-7008A-1]MDX3305019.1 FdhF/YdeP family oxidoreductase [Streptomyces sp. ME02-7008A]MYT53979.1 FdhF/YdeP family oxidoreductase [Streptomyces sp. SID7815]
MKKAPREEPDERLNVTPPKTWATGVPAVTHALEYSLAETSVRRTGLTLLTMNQVGGIDCPGCAWADPAPGHRHVNEYCENGAKHINDEATSRRVTADFFRRHTVSGLGRRSDRWLNQQGRLTEPMVKRPGADHYEPISWHDALGLLADELRSLDSPDEAVFYTSGRVSNEAAFLLQLFARAFGTNNLPDCSNMCHESSGFALHETLGTGKGTVSLDDLHHADLILVVGQNPGTNHPRQLSALEEAKRNGARVIAVNALPEAGLLRFRNPQKARGIIGRGVPIADQFLQIRSGGDLALFQGLNRLLLEAEDARPGTVLDQDFIRSDTSGFEEFSRHARTVAWEDVLVATGLTRGEIEKVRDEVLRSERVVVCWAMGVTQHRHGVPTIREIVNFLLLRGNLGKAGAGACPVRGHSNVQGDRTMGVWEQMPDSFLDALREEFGFEPPRAHGFDSVNAIRAMGEGRVKVFVGVAGNFVRAAPDSDVTEDAMRRCRLTVHVSTKLNRSHTVCGETALILPTLGRTERDIQATGEQFVTVENSMSEVHSSHGRLEPASKVLLSEVAILCRLAARTLDASAGIPWAEFEADYGTIRNRIARIVPGLHDFNRRVARPGGIRLPNPVNEGVYGTATGKAMFTRNAWQMLHAPDEHLVLQSLRSHDQWNTVPYTDDDRYRGIHGSRRVVLVNPQDVTRLGLAPGQKVDLVSVWAGGADRRAEDFTVVAYPTSPGCAAAYYPETNVLLPLDSVAESSNQPTAKGMVVRLEPRG